MTHRSTHRLAAKIVVVICLAVLVTPAIADWPQFRGVNSAGIAEGPAPPTEFGPEKNVKWKVPLASGHSSPVIVGDSIFLTTFDEDEEQLAVVCLSRDNGETQWTRDVESEEIEKGHPSFNPASSTVACDGETVVAYFGSYGLICFDMAGEPQWEIKMPLAKTYGGNAISPIIVGDRVILYRGTYDDHYVLAVNKKTGEEIWKKEHSEKFGSSMSSTAVPIISGDKMILHGAKSVQAFNVEDGEVVWKANCSTTGTNVPVLAGDKVIVATWNQTGEPDLTPVLPRFADLVRENDKDEDGLISKDELPRLMIFHRLEGTEAPSNGRPFSFRNADNDENGKKDGKITEEEWKKARDHFEAERAHYVDHGLLAIDLGSEGQLKDEQIRNLESKALPEVPSPLFYEGHVYFVKNGGILTTIDLAAGKRTSRLRTKGTGTHYASPIIAGGKIYSTAGNGKISVLSLGSKPKVVATNEMGELTYATPAVVDGVIYVRTHSMLYAFAEGT